MPTSSVDNFLPRGKILEINRTNVSSGTTIESNWFEDTGHSSVVGYAIAETGGTAVSGSLQIGQSIDKNEMDITDTETPTSQANTEPFEYPLVGNFVKATFTVNADADKVRVIVYRSTRVSPIN